MIGFFEGSPDNKSSSRLIGFIVIMACLAFVEQIILFAKSTPLQAASAAGLLFVTIAGPVMLFLYGQKKTEVDGQANNTTST